MGLVRESNPVGWQHASQPFDPCGWPITRLFLMGRNEMVMKLSSSSNAVDVMD